MKMHENRELFSDALQAAKEIPEAEEIEASMSELMGYIL